MGFEHMGAIRDARDTMDEPTVSFFLGPRSFLGCRTSVLTSRVCAAIWQVGHASRRMDRGLDVVG